MLKIAIIQFPGSNTERETFMACKRVNLKPVEFLWNSPLETLSNFDGYIIVGGFSYEDRSRAGVIAALDPIIKQIKIEASKNKPVLGICNGAQVLVESGMVPGVKDNKVAIALTDNKRIKMGQVVGVGYYNTWANLKMSGPPNRSAFTRHMKQGESINIPLAHGEGRFMIPENLLEKMIQNNQMVYRYCDDSGAIIDEFPTNPNGSIHNVAAICNPAGNVMAMMPHPERTKNGDVIFSSMKDFIEHGNPITNHSLNYTVPHYLVKDYTPNKKSIQWPIDMIITDNEASSVNNTLKQLGHDISIKRLSHWEISITNNQSSVLEKIDFSGELYNSNKEYIGKIKPEHNIASFLVRQKDDVFGRAKFESLTQRFKISELNKLKYGVVWNVTVNGSNFQTVLDKILKTNILYNPLSHECYRIN